MKINSTTVVAILALVIAIGTGSAFAGVKIANNSVGTSQLKDRSILIEDINRDAVRSLTGQRGQSGAADELSTSSALTIIRKKEFPLITSPDDPSDGRWATVNCLPGELVTGGGGALVKTISNGNPGGYAAGIQASFPSASEHGWTVQFLPNTTLSAIPTAYVVCLTP